MTMEAAPEPTVLGLIVAGQARIEKAVIEVNTKLDAKADRADISRIEATLRHQDDERRHLAERIGKLEKDAAIRDSATEAVVAHKSRVWTRREKAWGAVIGALGLGGIWFGPAVASLLSSTHH